MKLAELEMGKRRPMAQAHPGRQQSQGQVQRWNVLLSNASVVKPGDSN